MPAYTTVEFRFAKTSSAGLVRKVYDAFSSEGLLFSHVLAWGCDPNISLEEVIDWNQGKLDQGFELSRNEDISNNYRQILLSGHPFTECRLFILPQADDIAFHCIISEDQISELNSDSIQNAADRIWETLPVEAIDSYGEWLDDDLAPPAARIFAYVDNVTPAMQPERFNIQSLTRGCRLTRKREAE